MELRTLGTSGGIGRGQRTTALLVDECLLLDAGSGVGDLELEELYAIGDVVLTHAHLDHVAYLALMADARIGAAVPPLRVHALPETLEVLHKHLFNGALWPDFTVLPQPESPVLTFHPLPAAGGCEVAGYGVTPLPVAHSVPATGLAVDDGSVCFAFTGDTGPCPSLWAALQDLGRLDGLLVECALPDRLEALGREVGHYTPSALASDLQRYLSEDVPVWVTHLKPAEAGVIRGELRSALPEGHVQHVSCGQRLRL